VTIDAKCYWPQRTLRGKQAVASARQAREALAVKIR
jgi:hypothetical protein